MRKRNGSQEPSNSNFRLQLLTSKREPKNSNSPKRETNELTVLGKQLKISLLQILIKMVKFQGKKLDQMDGVMQ